MAFPIKRRSGIALWLKVNVKRLRCGRVGNDP
jgi:hypothetical protein